MQQPPQLTPEQEKAIKAVTAAVAEARFAQTEWEKRTFKQRADYLKVVHYRISERTQSISKAIFEDIHKPIRAAIASDILPTLDNLKVMMRKGHKVLKEESFTGSLSQFYIGSRKLKIIRQPYGVVGVIGNWSQPVYANFDPICAALLAGNTVVWKPSPRTPRTNEIIYQMFDEFPPGVFIKLDADDTMGEALSQADVNRIVFTGNTAVGRKVAAQAGARLTPVATEMSGKDSFIVTGNADVKEAARACAWGVTYFAGQNTVKPQRIFVQERSYERFRTLLKDYMTTISIGPADKPGVDMGPLVDERAVKVAEFLVNEAVQQGATLLCGGHRATDYQGHFFQPTIVENTTPAMRIEKGDLWAPVATLQVYKHESDLAQLINRHPMGFTASIWTKKTQEAEELGKRLNVGTIMVNTAVLSAVDAAIPFGGRKLSGNMERHGIWGVRDMTRPKTITISGGRVQPLFRANYKLTKKLLIVTIALKAGQYHKALKAAMSQRLGKEEI